MPECMSAMQASQSGSTIQLQKHVAVAEAAQPAFVIVVVTPSLSNLDEIVCLWLRWTMLYSVHFCVLSLL